jgi:hypothetical protein
MFHSHNQVGMRDKRQGLQGFVQILRTYFTGSAGAVNRFREADSDWIGHGAITVFLPLLAAMQGVGSHRFSIPEMLIDYFMTIVSQALLP